MRPVTQDRKSPKTRGHSGRTPSRGVTRGSAPQTYRRSKSGSGFFVRVGGFLRGLLDARRPMLWVTLTLLVPLGFAALLSAGAVNRAEKRTDTAAGTLASDAGFAVSQVHLAGNVRTTPAEIMNALALDTDQPIFAINLQDARARLLQLPWVADADVKRRYPDDVTVRIVERVPYARWQRPDGLYVVERDGRPITQSGADKFAKLPLLIGTGAPQAADAFVAAVAAHRGIVKRVAAYEYVGQRRWNLILDDGVVVKFPEDGWRKQLSVLDHLIVDKGILEADIREIDLRHPSYYFFTRRSGAPEQKDRKAETGSQI